jgi:hypothetical protein
MKAIFYDYPFPQKDDRLSITSMNTMLVKLSFYFSHFFLFGHVLWEQLLFFSWIWERQGKLYEKSWIKGSWRDIFLNNFVLWEKISWFYSYQINSIRENHT